MRVVESNGRKINVYAQNVAQATYLRSTHLIHKLSYHT